MPQYPSFSSATADIGGALYSSLAKRLASFSGEVYPLHVGDTWLEPAAGCRMEDLTVERFPGMHRYAPPRGLPAMIETIIDHVRARSAVPTERRNVLVTAGATGGLSALLGALLEPGDEVLVPAPYWPLIAGIVRRFHCRPVVIPMLEELQSADATLELLRSHLTGRSVALYLNSPNNPSGRLIPGSTLEALAKWARQEQLWLISDDVYEEYVYLGEQIVLRDLAPERTFSVNSFSKAYGMAGNRCGYLLGPAEALAEVAKISTHAWYCAPQAAQLAAIRALDGRGSRWISRAKERYQELGKLAAERLGLDPPQGGTFLFTDVDDRLDERGLLGFLEDCSDRGLFLAPGPSFGPYPTHVRICFTAVPPEIFQRGLGVLAEMLGKGNP